ncbi:MAG: hypothetical protein ABI591_09135 [Kofleriaceae bacterium]
MIKHACVMLLVVGCGGGSDHGTVALADLGTELGTSYCMKEFSCCTDAEIMMDFGAFKVGGQPVTTEPLCEMFYTGLFGALVSGQYMASIADGRATYDGDAAAACLDLVDSMSCSDFGAQAMIANDSGCKQFIIPQVVDGAACAQSYECTSNNCVGATTQPVQDGTCMPVPTSGQMCDFTCADGTFCDFTTGTCQPAKANGASCTSNDACASAFCNGAGSGSGTCADKLARCDGR